MTEEKLTNQNFDELSRSTKLSDDTKFNISKNFKHAKLTETVFNYIIRKLADEFRTKEALKNEVMKKFPSLTDCDWNEYYAYISEEIEEEKTTKTYMFTKLQGALWIREAFMQG